jgi:hypothetical protein
MKKLTVVSLVSLMLVFLAAFAVAAQAQTQMTPQMCTNLSTCNDLLGEMNAALRSGKLNPAEEQEVIANINKIGRIMQEMSSPGGAELEKKHSQELQETQDRWRRIREMQRGMQTKPGH